jgi:hypothetical protein
MRQRVRALVGRWGLLAMAVAGLLGLLLPGSVLAAADGGWAETNTNLAIVPEGDPAEVALTDGEPLVLVQMPVTKRIDHVTLGDLRVVNCSTGQPVRLKVEYHPDGDPWSTPSTSDVVTSASPAALPSAASKVSWDVPTTTLRKGRAYVFRVVSAGGSCASKMRRTTWSSSGPVFSGTATCALSATDIYWRRSAHAMGLGTDNGCNAVNFDASMPSGWLAVKPCEVGSCQKIQTSSGTSLPTTSCTNGGSWDTGGVWRYWRTQDGRNEYVCLWNQYADVGVNPQAPGSRGWHYSTDWLGNTFGQAPLRRGAPRDMYLVLGSVDYGALIQKHRPLLKYDYNESFFADDAREMIDAPGNQLIRRYAPEDPEWAQYPDGTRVLASHGGAGGNLSESVISHDYPSGFAVPFPSAGQDALSSSGDPAQVAGDMRDAGYADHIFGRPVFGADGKLWLQYWLWYYYNDFEHYGFGRHEGDWEMIQVGLDASNHPDVVTYATHSSGQKCKFDTVKSPFDADAPQVWVADGSHASYPFSGSSRIAYPAVPDATDQHWGDGANVRPTTELVTSEWASFWGWPGRWGQKPPDTFGIESPPAPREQAKWSDPSGFYEHANACESPLDAARHRERKRPPGQVRMAPPNFTAHRSGRSLVLRYVPRRTTDVPKHALVRVVVHSSDVSEPAMSRFRHAQVEGGMIRTLLPRGAGPYRVDIGFYDKFRRYGRVSTRFLP